MATTDTTPMDVDALYQASQLPLPPDPVEAQQLWASLAADLAAAADEIKRLAGRGQEYVVAFHREVDRRLAAERREQQRMRDLALMRESAEAAWGRVGRLEEALQRAVYIAEHLLGMIDRDTWRAQGAEWMGQYEGDHWAEQTFSEINELAALAPAEGRVAG